LAPACCNTESVSFGPIKVSSSQRHAAISGELRLGKTLCGKTANKERLFSSVPSFLVEVRGFEPRSGDTLGLGFYKLSPCFISRARVPTGRTPVPQPP